MKNNHVLEVDSVMISFGELHLLTDIAITCRTGDIIGLLGRNGSGKSTLLKIIFGTQHTFNKNIRIDGRPYEIPYKKGNLIAYLPQKGFLPTSLSLKRIIDFFIPTKEKRKYLSTHFRIYPFLNKTTKELSGGELRFFEVLLLVNMDVKFVLLDEPFSGIEPIYKDVIRETLNDYREEKGFIITDHDYKSILKTTDSIVLLTNGRSLNIGEFYQLEQYHYVPKGTFSGADIIADNEDEPFDIDNQTLSDLDIFKMGESGLIVQMFNSVKSDGAYKKLRYWMANPSTNYKNITNRRDAIKYYKENGLSFDYPEKNLKFILHYINGGVSVLSDNYFDIGWWHLKNIFKNSNEHYLLTEGVKAILILLEHVVSNTSPLKAFGVPDELSHMALKLEDVYKRITHIKGNHQLSVFSIARLHNYFQTQGRDDLQIAFDTIYYLETISAIASAAQIHKLNFVDYHSGDNQRLEFEGLFHPLLENAVSNNFMLKDGKHLCFLTGANMSGKSTFLKSVALSVYLAHLGFPVPAKSMSISLFKGLLTTINLSDNILKGYSHFYSEVKRVKEAAVKIQKNKKMFVVFDELFRGTNVKDAADASLLVTSALAQIPNTVSLISTHIIEIAENLQDHPSIIFKCFSIEWKDGQPEYNYLLTDGVSAERLGLHILKEEGIIDILEKAKVV